MEEENDQDLEERLYSMLHYIDESQSNVTTNQENNTRVLENAPRSTIRRYWRTSGDYNNSHQQKINQPNKPDTAPPPPQTSTQKAKPKEEKNPIAVSETSTISLSIFQSEPEDVKKSIVILENDDMKVVELESSDEDEVIEVALPPKPTITIESSDEDESKDEQKTDIIIETPEKEKSVDFRAVSASPVPSVVSSVSDEFIRGDCIALNISSRRPDKHSFDFSQHGSDLVSQNTPSKKKKKKKNKDPASSTPIIEQAPTPASNNDETFVTPRSKAKNKKQKKSFDVSNKSIPSADIYDSDSNQSVLSIVSNAANNNNYTVTEKSFPSIDIYESDSSQPEAVSNQKALKPSNEGKSSDCTITVEQDTATAKKPRKDSLKEFSKTTRKDSNQYANESLSSIVDLTENETINDTIEENFVMANVTGFIESEDYEHENIISSAHKNEVSKFCSTKIPSILFENLDFDNLKGNKVNKIRSFSRSKLRAEMDKFYNESWGGEDFNHREIQKNMPRDKNLWMIDPKDRMPTPRRRVLSCNYCNRPGHRDETCRMKPPVCFMCGSIGHNEPRCPKKICVNCGSPNSMYSSMCRNCSSWGRVTCNECGQIGHPSSHCPDIWRRYHNTTDFGTLEECRQSKGKGSLFCSGCTRRGHLIHNCRSTLPFSNLPINSPCVFLYKPVYRPDPIINHQHKPYRTPQQETSVTTATPIRNEFNKRQSQSPVVHETHNNKKKATMNSDTPRMKDKDNLVVGAKPQEASNKSIQIPEPAIADTPKKSLTVPEKALDYIPISSNNHDVKGQMIQDNEVSDTSNVVTSARIYITDEMMTSLKSQEGEQWLKATEAKWDVHVQCADTFLSIKGKFDDQESFQADLKEWANIHQKKVLSVRQVLDETTHTNENAENESFAHLNIPRNRNNILRKLNNAFDSLKNDFGDPNDMYKELNFLQNRHQQLLKEKVLSPDKLLHSRNNINDTQKKLNLVLLGQAGLADGPEHLKKLHLLQQKVTNSRNKNVTPEMRKEIGEHFHSVFTSSPRDDYAELLKKFYISKQKSTFKSKKKNFSLATNKHNQNNLKNNFQQQKSYNAQKELSETGNVNKINPARMRPVVEKTKNKLVFFHKRLLSARPIDSVLKNTRLKLVAKLHSNIALLLSNPQASPKFLNKMRKVSHQAKVLLNKL